MHRNFLIIGIIIALFTGALLGGFFPSAAVHFSILGDILLNLLMMAVVPLVICSIITGITGLETLRGLGALGRRTVVYYLATTSVSVLIGIVLVNLISPGSSVTTGEEHPSMEYSIAPGDPYSVRINTDMLKKKNYGESYCLVLRDQELRGYIELVGRGEIRVKQWEESDDGSRLTVHTDSGGSVPVSLREGKLALTAERLAPSGRGVGITLPLSSAVIRSRNRSAWSVLREVVTGDPESGREGLIPRNIANAMARMDFLAIIVFSLILGIAITSVGEKGLRAAETVASFNHAIHRIIDWVLLFVPIGIFGLISSKIGSAGGFAGFFPELIALGKYAATVLLGLFIHGALVLPLVLFFFRRVNPFAYMRNMAPALLNAFSTASSSATLPLTMEAVEKRNGVQERISSFVLPIGATINMDGTALYEAVAALFIAQVYGIEMGPAMQAVIFLTATLAAIGAAGIPEAGLVTMVVVLNAVGLPVEGIGLLLSIDWILDRFRTTVNAWGDAVGAGVIDALEKNTSPLR